MKQSFIILINFITLYSFVKIRCNYFVSLRPKFISKQCNFNYKIIWFCIKWSLSISRRLCTIIATLVLTAFLKAQLWWSLSRGRAPECQFCGIHKGNKKNKRKLQFLKEIFSFTAQHLYWRGFHLRRKSASRRQKNNSKQLRKWRRIPMILTQNAEFII